MKSPCAACVVLVSARPFRARAGLPVRLAAMALRASKALTHQLRIVLQELQQSSNYQPSEMLVFGRRYAAEMYLCAQQLRDQAMQQSSASSGAESPDELRAELQRVLWAACIWELCMTVFVGRPALLTDDLVQWWNLHLDDRKLTEQELPALEALDAPETRPTFWTALRRLAARGLTELALRLLRQHSALRAAAAAGGDEAVLLERLETLIELMPRLNEPSLMQPMQEDTPLGHLENAALTEFKDQHRVWSSDLTSLARDADAAPSSMVTAREVAATARLLCGDDAAIRACCDSWHARLVATLLYQQPTTLRWQLGEVIDRCLPPAERNSLDPFAAVLVSVLSDDPYGTLKAVRHAYGDGWLIAHLWDLLWRAGAVGVDLMPGSTLDVRSFLMLQHARALGTCPSLWQLSALYAVDLLEPAAPPAPSAAALSAPRSSLGGGLFQAAGGTTQLNTLGSANAAARDSARAWLQELVTSQPLPLHSVKLRKLLAFCEQHGMQADARALIGRAANAKRAARQAAATATAPAAAPPPRRASFGAPTPMSAAAATAAATAAAAAAAFPATSAVAARPGATTPGFVSTDLSAEPSLVSPLIALAAEAFDEAVEAAHAPAHAPAGGGGAGGAAVEGRATAELRAMLRCEGMGGMGQYYAGPRWLPPYFALLGVIAAPTAAAAVSTPNADAGAAAAPPIEARSLLISLASARGNAVGDSLPDSLMYKLLRFVAGLTRHAASHKPLLLPGAGDAASGAGAPPPSSPPAYSVHDLQVLLGQYEALKVSVLNTAPAEGANSRAHRLPEGEKKLSLALSQALAAAVLYESALPSRGTCWGSGLSAAPIGVS